MAIDQDMYELQSTSSALELAEHLARAWLLLPQWTRIDISRSTPRPYRRLSELVRLLLRDKIAHSARFATFRKYLCEYSKAWPRCRFACLAEMSQSPVLTLASVPRRVFCVHWRRMSHWVILNILLDFPLALTRWVAHVKRKAPRCHPQTPSKRNGKGQRGMSKSSTNFSYSASACLPMTS